MAISGKSGKIAIGETAPVKVVGIKNWSLDLSVDTHDTTALGDDWKNNITGLKEWTATAEGDFNVHSDETGQEALQDAYMNGSEVDMAFYVDDTHFYGGKALINSLSIEDPVDDIVSISVDFTGNGAIAFS